MVIRQYSTLNKQLISDFISRKIGFFFGANSSIKITSLSTLHLQRIFIYIVKGLRGCYSEIIRLL